MPLTKEIKDAIYSYCNNHLANESWYNEEFEFIENESLRKRLIEEFKGIRFAYKLYEGIEIDLTSELIEIYGYRNAIHLVAEQRKGIEYELELSKRAYRRMSPFINQIKSKLKMDQKGIYANEIAIYKQKDN